MQISVAISEKLVYNHAVKYIIAEFEENFNMRMRKKKNGEKRIAACSDYIVKAADEISNLPCDLEIGCGKGSFILGLSKKNPNVNYYAMEKISDVLLLAAEKIKGEEIQNVKFIVGDATNLKEYFPSGSVNRIYLNFSDPWPKKGYAKRRLTHRRFLEIYKDILSKNGQIIFKTDNIDLFEFSLIEFEEMGFKLSEVTRDLHNSEYNENNIVTEYEANFSAKGFKINRVVASL